VAAVVEVLVQVAQVAQVVVVMALVAQVHPQQQIQAVAVAVPGIVAMVVRVVQDSWLFVTQILFLWQQAQLVHQLLQHQADTEFINGLEAGA
jgi:hypothetical protein